MLFVRLGGLAPARPIIVYTVLNSCIVVHCIYTAACLVHTLRWLVSRLVIGTITSIIIVVGICLQVTAQVDRVRVTYTGSICPSQKCHNTKPN